MTRRPTHRSTRRSPRRSPRRSTRRSPRSKSRQSARRSRRFRSAATATPTVVVHRVELKEVLQHRTDKSVTAALNIERLLDGIENTVKIIEVNVPSLSFMTISRVIADVGPWLARGGKKPTLIGLLETLLLHFDALFLVGRCALMCYVTPNAETILKWTPSGEDIYRPYKDEEYVLAQPHLAMRTPDSTVQRPKISTTYEEYITGRLHAKLPDPMDNEHVQQRYRLMRIVYNDKKRFPDTSPVEEFLKRYNMGLRLLGMRETVRRDVLHVLETRAAMAEERLSQQLTNGPTTLPALDEALKEARETGGGTQEMISKADTLLKDQ